MHHCRRSSAGPRIPPCATLGSPSWAQCSPRPATPPFLLEIRSARSSGASKPLEASRSLSKLTEGGPRCQGAGLGARGTVVQPQQASGAPGYPAPPPSLACGATAGSQALAGVLYCTTSRSEASSPRLGRYRRAHRRGKGSLGGGGGRSPVGSARQLRALARLATVGG